MAQVALYITTILAFWRSLTYQKVSRIELAELEKNPKKNSIDRFTSQFIYVSIDDLSFNDSLWILPVVPMSIFNQMDT